MTGLKANTRHHPKARENANKPTATGFSFAYDWLRRWREFPLEQSKIKLNRNQCTLRLFEITLTTKFVKFICKSYLHS